MRNPALMHPSARAYSHLPAGHPEGWNDAFKNNLQAFYSYIFEGKRPAKTPAISQRSKRGIASCA
jgi:hypothetical protein